MIRYKHVRGFISCEGLKYIEISIQKIDIRIGIREPFPYFQRKFRLIKIKSDKLSNFYGGDIYGINLFNFSIELRIRRQYDG